MPVPDTLLAISPIAIPLYSSRGLTQTLEPIDESVDLRRTINGVLKNLTPMMFRKYKTSITCEDANTFAVGRLWPGDTIVIDCVPELNYITATGSAERPVVSGSSRVEGDFTFYRPQITFMVSAFSVEKDEWGAVVSWQLDAEEV